MEGKSIHLTTAFGVGRNQNWQTKGGAHLETRLTVLEKNQYEGVVFLFITNSVCFSNSKTLPILKVSLII
jgi:hypothetical protein